MRRLITHAVLAALAAASLILSARVAGSRRHDRARSLIRRLASA